MQQAHKQFNAFNKARPRSVEIRIAVDGVDAATFYGA